MSPTRPSLRCLSACAHRTPAPAPGSSVPSCFGLSSLLGLRFPDPTSSSSRPLTLSIPARPPPNATPVPVARPLPLKWSSGRGRADGTSFVTGTAEGGATDSAHRFGHLRSEPRAQSCKSGDPQSCPRRRTPQRTPQTASAPRGDVCRHVERHCAEGHGLVRTDQLMERRWLVRADQEAESGDRGLVHVYQPGGRRGCWLPFVGSPTIHV